MCGNISSLTLPSDPSLTGDIYNNVWEVNADYRPPCVITYVNRFGEERPYIPTSREMTTARWRLVEKKDIRWEDEWGEKFDTKPVSEW